MAALETLELAPAWVKAQELLTRHAARLAPGKKRRRAGGRRMVVMVVGGKGLGKSTFLRHLAQALCQLEAVGDGLRLGYFDTDLGQPEFGVPGVVSYRGLRSAEGVARPTEEGEAIFVGDKSPAEHPSSYMDAVRRLAAGALAEEESESGEGEEAQVLLVNTHGWNVRLGALMVAGIAEFVGVTHVVHLKAARRTDEIDLSGVATVTKSISLEGHGGSSTYSPAEARFLRYAQYFGARALSDLEARAPFAVPLADLRVVQSIEPSEAPALEDDELLHALNSCLVGLCRAEGDLFHFVGLGLVRAICVDTKRVFLVSPVTLGALATVDTLVVGTIAAPLARWQENNVAAVAAKPFFVHGVQSTNLVRNKLANLKNLKRRRLVNARA